MADKTTNQLLIDNPGFVPDLADGIPVYDTSAGSTKAATLAAILDLNNSIFKVLSANATGTDTSSAQPWFPTSGGAAVASSTTYLFDGQLRLSRSAGTVSHTTSLLFGGTAVLGSIKYIALANTGDTVANATPGQTSSEAATATVIKAASTSATEQISVRVKGIVRVTTGGTLIPQFQYSTAPGGAPSVLANSYFRLERLGTNAVTSQGTWS